jgi:hypothetical protein
VDTHKESLAPLQFSPELFLYLCSFFSETGAVLIMFCEFCSGTAASHVTSLSFKQTEQNSFNDGGRLPVAADRSVYSHLFS